jgi:two-component system cell cycle response regulator
MCGEEVVVIMPETDIVRACQVGERLRMCIAADVFQIDSQTAIRVTASAGVATLEHPEDTPETLFKRADRALYTAKREGRNRVVADAA